MDKQINKENKSGSREAAQSIFKSVRKRDGRVVSFDQNRITRAVYRAMQATGEGDLSKDPIFVSEKVLKLLLKKFKTDYTPNIEEIQDAVEEILILSDFPKTAKAYILYRQQRFQVREKRKMIPEKVQKLAEESKKYFRSPLSEFVYYRSYSRWIEEEGRRETWIESIDRYVNFMKENLGEALKAEEYEEIREAILRQEVMPSMRLMWGAGKAARKTNVSAYNCSFIAPTRLQDLPEIMYLSMCGTGVGFSVESQNVQRFPIIKIQQTRQNFAGQNLGGQNGRKKKVPIHVIEDSKEGWCDALKLGLKTWYRGQDVSFDYSKLRPAGAPLLTMGGRSSGPDPLRALLDFTRAKILSKQGKRLSNIDVHDVICKIGEVVVSGGVRRSALISLSDLDDQEMRLAKAGQFWLNNSQRSMANNSAVYNHKPSAAQFMEEWLSLAQSGSGERGIFNRGGLKSQLPARRWKVFEKYAGKSGTNPCVTADTWVVTSDGARQVKELLDKPFKAIVNGKTYEASAFFKTGFKDVFEILTDKGFGFKATEEHKVLVADYVSRKILRTNWKEIKNLKPGDRVVLHNHKDLVWEGKGTEYEGWLIGNLLGDGNLEKNGKANLDYWGDNRVFMMQYAVSLVHSTVGGRSDSVGHIAETGYARVQSMALGRLAQNYGMSYGQKIASEEIEKTSSVFYQGFLRGWFDADGSVQGNQQKGVSIRLNSSSLSSLYTAQRMLARLGIISSIYSNRKSAGWKWMPDNKGGQKLYFCKDNHELIISGENILSFAERIGFVKPPKKNKLQDILLNYHRELNRERFLATVSSISYFGKEEVFDCQVKDVHAFDGNGVYIHNCGEIILRSKMFCNLSEVVSREEDTKETLLKKMRIATILGTYQSTLTHFPYLSKDWKKNCEEERLLGVSVTGQWDCPAVRNPEVLEKLKKYAIEINKIYAKKMGINQSTCITCVKPSGTVSQLVDAASGMHPRHAPYYIRRIRISATDRLFHMMKDQKFPYHPEVGQAEGSANTYVLEFPVKAPKGAVFKNDLTAIQQLEHWKIVKEKYTEHNPSVTISVGDGEWIEVSNWLYKNWEILGGLSFLPRSDYVYQLAPYEEIDEKRYNELLSKMPAIDFSQIIAYEEEDVTEGAKELACVSGVCEVDFSGEVSTAPTEHRESTEIIS